MGAAVLTIFLVMGLAFLIDTARWVPDGDRCVVHVRTDNRLIADDSVVIVERFCKE